jgi:YjbE family integral membrane protein
MPVNELSFSWNFVVSLLSIILINLALSGDNAIAIGMAAASLPRNNRKWAIIAGGVLAIVLRIGLTSAATLLFGVPLLSAIGGCALFWVTWRLMRIDVSEDEAKKASKRAQNMRQAILLIVTADLMMSLDNVLAIAGSAHGDIKLLVIGLVLSMPLLLTTGGAISLLIDKFKWLVTLGGAVISFTGTRMILEDHYISTRMHTPSVLVIIISIAVGIIVPGIFILINRAKKGENQPQAKII